jgi:hypothetical protein
MDADQEAQDRRVRPGLPMALVVGDTMTECGSAFALADRAFALDRGALDR